MNKQYRKNVAVVLFNKDKNIFVCERIIESNSWQFPQGGVDEGEALEHAVFRELFEETSVKSATLIKILEKPIRYDFPKSVQEELWEDEKNDKYCGQEQYWALLYFHGKDDEINIKTEIPEFKKYKWSDINFIMNNVVDFKKAAYEKGLEQLKPYIDSYEISER